MTRYHCSDCDKHFTAPTSPKPTTCPLCGSDKGGGGTRLPDDETG